MSESSIRSFSAALFALCLTCGTATAGDPAAGLELFNNIPDSVVSCSNASCHGPNPNDNIHGLLVAANNPGVIQTAIKMGVTQMMFLNGLLNPFQLDDLAAYLAPQPQLSGSALDFGEQASGTTSAPQSVTLHSAGGQNLDLTAITLGGPNAGDFIVGGSCKPGTSLASTTIGQPGGDCEVSVSFRPGSSGARNATITLSYAGTATFPSAQTIALSGTGDVALEPVAAISTDYIDFGEIAIGESSSQHSVTIANDGNTGLVVSSLALVGRQVDEFDVAGSCMQAGLPLTIAPGLSCTVVIEFKPRGGEARSAALRIFHNAAASPGLVVLSGIGLVPTCAPPAPASETMSLSCPAGQQGTLTQTRDYVCQGTAWVPGAWVVTANQCKSAGPEPDRVLAEYFNEILDHYFVTASSAEQQAIAAGEAGPGWQATNVALGRVWSELGAAPLVHVCRFYGNNALDASGRRIGPNSHFYTADAAECEAVKSDPGWRYEGDVFSVVAPSPGGCTAPLRAVQRVYNARFAQNDSNHRYSIDTAILTHMAALGWVPEGVVFCISP